MPSRLLTRAAALRLRTATGLRPTVRLRLRLLLLLVLLRLALGHLGRRTAEPDRRRELRERGLVVLGPLRRRAGARPLRGRRGRARDAQRALRGGALCGGLPVFLSCRALSPPRGEHWDADTHLGDQRRGRRVRKRGERRGARVCVGLQGGDGAVLHGGLSAVLKMARLHGGAMALTCGWAWLLYSAPCSAPCAPGALEESR